MKGRAIHYSVDELAFIYLRRDTPRRELHAAFVEWFGRHDVTLVHLNSLCKRRGWMTGRTGCFPRGNRPHNAGQKGFCPPGCEKGWFRKGERRGVAARLYKPVGTERLCEDGYLERKIHDGMPLQSRWRAVHLIEWEKANGRLPEGHCLKCLDGDRLNTDPANWEAIPRAMLPRLNGGQWKTRLAYDDAPDELKPAILAVAKLDHGARQRRGRA